MKKALNTFLENSGLASLWRANKRGRVVLQLVLLVPLLVWAFALSPIMVRWLSNDPTAETLGVKHLQVIVYALVLLPTFSYFAWVAAQLNDNLFETNAAKGWNVKLLLYCFYLFLFCYLAVNAR